MSRSAPRTATRLLRSASAATALGVMANGLRLRGRAEGLAQLEAPVVDAPEAWVPDGWRCITARGVDVLPRTRAAATAWADAEGLDAVDLVPGDLPVERALDLLRQVECATFRQDPLVEGRTAGHAILVREDLAKRADLSDGPVTPAELIEVARQVKRFAPRTTDFVVAPEERAADQDADERLAVQRTVFDRYTLVNITASAGELAVLGAGAAVAPAVGFPALGVHLLQPALVLSGAPGGLAPRDLARHTPLRWFEEVRRVVGLLRADAPRPTSVRIADELRPQYREELALGTDRFFEPRVEACPWCGSADIALALTSPDLIQHKPGTFELDECGSCGHIFQNPRLTLDGLDFYYRDFYDGFAGDEMERVFASETGEYDGRSEMVAEHDPAPARWLDVGSGHAHFCLVAKSRFPDTSFEGVDQSSAIEDAAHRGWVDRSHRGLFPELAPSLAGRFDVVSMLHYLEHTRDPRAELDAAAETLAPGGLLLIELPDPECRWGRLLGNLWMPWLQPQHQHFVSIARLEEALEQRGFTLLSRYRSPSTKGLDLVPAVWFALGQIAPRPWMPWLAPPTLASRAWRVAVCAAGAPVMVASMVIGRVVSAFIEDDDSAGNAFRVLARYDGRP